MRESGGRDLNQMKEDLCSAADGMVLGVPEWLVCAICVRLAQGRVAH